MEDSIRYAKKYLEDLLSFFGLNTDVYATSEDDVIELEIPSTHLNGFLIGQRGDTMRSMQFLVSNALKNQGYEYTRVNVDVAEYKKQRAQRLQIHRRRPAHRNAAGMVEWTRALPDRGSDGDV